MTFVTTLDNLYIRIRDLCCPYGLKGNMTVVQEFSYFWEIEKKYYYLELSKRPTTLLPGPLNQTF